MPEISSPVPVAVARPTPGSTKRPCPAIGESPTRPGTLNGRPLVEQPAASLPSFERPRTPMVSWPKGAAPAGGSPGRNSRPPPGPPRPGSTGRNRASPDPDESPVASGSRSRQATNAARASGACSSTDSRPWVSAKSSASSPQSKRCSVRSITNRATATGWRWRRRPQTPPNRSGDSMIAPSRLIRPLASGRPPNPTLSTSGSRSACRHAASIASRSRPSPTTACSAFGAASPASRRQPASIAASEKDQVPTRTAESRGR